MDVTLRNLHEVYRLLDACLRYGGDPTGWRQTLAEGLRELFGGINAHCGEYTHINDPARAGVLDFVATDWPTPEQARSFARYQVSGKHVHDPPCGGINTCAASSNARANPYSFSLLLTTLVINICLIIRVPFFRMVVLLVLLSAATRYQYRVAPKCIPVGLRNPTYIFIPSVHAKSY